VRQLRRVPLRLFRGPEFLGATLGRDLVQLLARLCQHLASAGVHRLDPER
jgi:hypothetical protein